MKKNDIKRGWTYKGGWFWGCSLYNCKSQIFLEESILFQSEIPLLTMGCYCMQYICSYWLETHAYVHKIQKVCAIAGSFEWERVSWLSLFRIKNLLFVIDSNRSRWVWSSLAYTLCLDDCAVLFLTALGSCSRVDSKLQSVTTPLWFLQT